MSDQTEQLSSTATKTAAAAIAGAALLSPATASAQVLQPLGPKSTGTPGPGPFAGGRVRFERTGVAGNVTFGNFGCTVFKENADTPDWMTANVYFKRGVTNYDLKMPDGAKVRCWSFDDPLRKVGPKATVPSSMIRVQEGDLVHTMLDSSKGSHTIHHHGIEPTTMNDGVGHVSMEITSDFIYQWQARKAGTYFYHCHKNTVTHFEMGLMGLLIVDPKPDPIDGRIRAFEGGPNYDVEAFWVLDDMDPRWHQITDKDHDVGLCGTDSGLNIFKPKYFLITGTPTSANKLCVEQKVVAKSGQKILIRLLNASYSVLAVTFESLQAEIIAVDGQALNRPWNRSQTVAPGQTIFLSTAQRYDLLIDTTLPINRNAKYKGINPVSFEFQDWITRKRHNLGNIKYEGFARTTVEIS